MSVYSGFKVYGPYTRADGRQHVVLTSLNNPSQHKTVSYPKFIVETYLDRYLGSDETVDHIDGNFCNNELSNLRVLKRAEHCRSHVTARQVVVKRCSVCGKAFSTDVNQRVTCGDRRCIGRCAHVNGYNKGNSFMREANRYTSLRSLVAETPSVEGANSGNLLVENPEQAR